jgi:hypothetical protein
MLVLAVAAGAMLARVLSDDKPTKRDRDEDRGEEQEKEKEQKPEESESEEPGDMSDEPTPEASSSGPRTGPTRSETPVYMAPAPTPEPPAEVDNSIGEAIVSLTIEGANAAWFCTPGDIGGEFNGRVEFKLAPSEHFYADAVSTCIVQMGENFRKRGQGEFKGSFLVRGLGLKSFSCSKEGQIISCSGG